MVLEGVGAVNLPAAAAFVCGSLTVSLGHHQWEFTDRQQFLERPFGTTDYGATPRQVYDGHSIQQRTVKFVKTEVLMDALRKLTYQVGKTAAEVHFVPDDTDMGTYWVVDWQSLLEVTRIASNREEVTLTLQEQAT